MPNAREQTFSTANVMNSFGLGRNTLRLYEEMGLLSGMRRTQAGYREFTARHLSDIKFILEAKRAGFTLSEIKTLLSAMRTQTKMTCGTVSGEISEKVVQIEEAIAQLQTKKQFLADFLKTCSAKSSKAECDVLAAGFSKNACCD